MTYLREQGSTGTRAHPAAAPIVQEKIGRLGEFPAYAGFLFRRVEPDPAFSTRSAHGGGRRAGDVDRGGRRSRRRSKRLCERLGEKPRTVYLPIRVAVTGSRISPGLYESLELLGRESLARLRRGAALAATN